MLIKSFKNTTVWVKIAPKPFCDVFIRSEKFSLVVAEPYSYMCTNVGPLAEYLLHCVTFAGKTSQILTIIQFSLLQDFS